MDVGLPRSVKGVLAVLKGWWLVRLGSFELVLRLFLFLKQTGLILAIGIVIAGVLVSHFVTGKAE